MRTRKKSHCACPRGISRRLISSWKSTISPVDRRPSGPRSCTTCMRVGSSSPRSSRRCKMRNGPSRKRRRSSGSTSTSEKGRDAAGEVSEGASVTITSPPTGWPQRATLFIFTASSIDGRSGFAEPRQASMHTRTSDASHAVRFNRDNRRGTYMASSWRRRAQWARRHRALTRRPSARAPHSRFFAVSGGGTGRPTWNWLPRTKRRPRSSHSRTVSENSSGSRADCSAPQRSRFPRSASSPLLIIGMPKNESYFIVYLSAAVQAYRYEEVRISVSGTNPPSNGTQDENETYGLHMWVPTQVPSNGSFTIHTYLVDQVKNYFEYNVTVRAVRDAGRTVMVFTFPDEKDNPNLEIRRNAQGEDFRWVVPQRGKLP